MRNCINIKGNGQIFPYIVEYSKDAKTNNGDNITNGGDIRWSKENNLIRLYEHNIAYYKDNSNWYHKDRLNINCNENIPENVPCSNIKVYIPAHSISTYIKNIKYVLNLNTWVNGIKIDFGSFIFNSVDTIAIPSEMIKKGNNEYYEYISFDIIDPFYLIYSDNWKDFREKNCYEIPGTNNTGSSLYASLFVIEEYEDSFILNNEYIGGYTSFNISSNDDYLVLNISPKLDPFGFLYTVKMNSEYNSLLEYLYETYNIKDKLENNSKLDIELDLVIKNKDSIIADSSTVQPVILKPYSYNIPIEKITAKEDFGIVTQEFKWNKLNEHNIIKSFFKNWDNFEEGWNLVGSITFYENNENAEEKIELFSIVSNEIPITQEIFSQYINGGCEKIIKLEDMDIHTYNVVNKIENKIYQIERPNESKANIINITS